MICVNNLPRSTPSVRAILTLSLILALVACTTTATKEDPLKYTKKLVRQGHVSLYNNGAFQVPMTTIKLIPAGESATGVALEMMGFKARQSFLTSLRNAADSVYLIPKGSRLSIDYAKKIRAGGDSTAGAITGVSRPVGKLIIDRSAAAAKKLTLHAWNFGKQTAAEMDQLGIGIEKGSQVRGEQLSDSLTGSGMAAIGSSLEYGRRISGAANRSARETLSGAGESFVKGYLALPEKLSSRANVTAEAAAPHHFSEAYARADVTRAKYSRIMSDLVVESTGSYVNDVQSSFHKAGEAFSGSIDATGFGLAFLKSSRWVLQGVLWDGLVKPVTKLGAASVGYIGVNMAAFPVMVVVNEGVAVTNLAVEATWNSAGAAYDLVAPSAKAAIASVYSLLQFTGGNLVAGGTTAGMATYGTASAATGVVAGNAVKGIGYISGKSVQYVGVPIAAAGVTLGAGTVGVVAGGAGAVAGSTVLVAGEAASVTTKTFGNVLAGGTVVAGTTASAAGAAASGVYELAKSVVVPVSYELGGGIVLGYTSTSQLAAHSVLAVADASYLVLSLEGPRWVIYAVKGRLGNGDDLEPGTVVDLEEMQSKGEKFSYLPVSNEEMNGVVEGLYREVPATVTPTAAGSATDH